MEASAIVHRGFGVRRLVRPRAALLVLGIALCLVPSAAGASGITSDGNHVWVAEYQANAVDELDATGGVVAHRIPAAGYGLSHPCAVLRTGGSCGS